LPFLLCFRAFGVFFVQKRKNGFKKHCLKKFIFSSSFFGLFIKNNNFVIQSTLYYEPKYSRRFSSHSFHDGTFFKVYFLSGLSGVFAGVFALLGAGYVAFLFESNEMSYFDGLEKKCDLIDKLISRIVILVLALLSGFLFTLKAKKIIYQSGLLPQK
jgi:hypothetical protein